jgi:hypothetical protein
MEDLTITGREFYIGGTRVAYAGYIAIGIQLLVCHERNTLYFVDVNSSPKSLINTLKVESVANFKRGNLV